MAPAFKIAFPLPGRRTSASPQGPPGSYASPNECGISPHWHPMSKAEEALGARTPDSSESSNAPKKGKLQKDRKNLRRLPSFMSVTLANVDGDSPNSEEGIPFSDMRPTGAYAASQSPARATHRLSRHGSSPVLGSNVAVTTSEVDYFTDHFHDRSHQHLGSTPMSQSSQNKEKSLLATGSRIIFSTTGDAPGPKGVPRVPSPLAHEMQGSCDTPEMSRSHSRNVSKESERSRTTANSLIASMPRRRPSVMDRPTLNPNAPQILHAVSPPPALINASLPKPMQPGYAPMTTAGKLSRWSRMKQKSSRLQEPEKVPLYRPRADDFSSVKVNVKRPKIGASNWFDSIATDDSASETASQVNEYSRFELTEELAAGPVITPVLTSSKAEQMLLSEEPSSPSSPGRKSSFNNKIRQTGMPERKLSFKLDGPPTRFPQPKASARLSYSKSAPSSPTGHRTVRSNDGQRGIPCGIDLQIQSVLNLSSSDDETEGGPPMPKQQAHRPEAKEENAVYGTDGQSAGAAQIKPSKPRQSSNRSLRRSAYGKSGSLEAVPPVPQIPFRPELNQRPSSTRWRELLEAKDRAQLTGTTPEAEAGDSTVDSGASSITDITPSSTPARSLSARYSKRISSSLRGSKLMKVTMEEEQLLEAMREERASIRANDFQKRFTSAMQQMRASDLISRPRTAGADGAPSTARSSLYAPSATTGITVPSTHGSISPPLLTPAVYKPPTGAKHIYKASLGTISRLSASADDLTVEDSYPFPHIPSEPLPLPGPPTLATGSRSHFGPLTSCPPHLNTLSLTSAPGLPYGSPSEVLPPTPSIRGFPITPPPGGQHDVRRASSPPRSSGGGRSNPSAGDRARLVVKTHPASIGNAQDSATLNSAAEDIPDSDPIPAGISVPEVADSSTKSLGHERQRTTSSSVVMLDGMESFAARVDEENDIAGWAMERW